jgi:hypothetical protein
VEIYEKRLSKVVHHLAMVATKSSIAASRWIACSFWAFLYDFPKQRLSLGIHDQPREAVYGMHQARSEVVDNSPWKPESISSSPKAASVTIQS